MFDEWRQSLRAFIGVFAIVAELIRFVWAVLKLACYIVLMPFVLVGTLVTAPYWYPRNKKRRCEKRLRLLSLLTRGQATLCQRQGGDEKTNLELKKLANLSDDEFEALLLSTLESCQSDQSWVFLRIDWAATDEVAPQANALARHLGVPDTFAAEAATDESDFVETALMEYGVWLAERGFRLVFWDQGSDEYIALVCQQAQFDELCSLGKTLRLTLKPADIVAAQ